MEMLQRECQCSAGGWVWCARCIDEDDGAWGLAACLVRWKPPGFDVSAPVGGLAAPPFTGAPCTSVGQAGWPALGGSLAGVARAGGWNLHQAQARCTTRRPVQIAAPKHRHKRTELHNPSDTYLTHSRLPPHALVDKDA